MRTHAVAVVFRPSRHDAEILRLAVLALGSLAAEPLYVLVDTAIVGHLGRPQLAALGIAGVVLSGLFAIFNFLAYGTTAQVARAAGAGRREVADRLGAQAFWLSLALGCALAALLAAFAEPVVALMGGEGQTADYAVTYTRIASLGLPFAFLALGGQGYMRGIADLRTPLVILVAANAANVVLEVVFVYGFGWGIAGSAWGTAIAQAGMGVAFAASMWRLAAGRFRLRIDLMRRLLAIGRHIFVRTSALYASLAVAGAVATRFGDASIGAHQIAFQLWIFLAFVLDAVAIAGQVIVGRMLGAGDPQGAFTASVRMIVMSVALGTAFAAAVLALATVLPRVFTGDAAVIGEARDIWALFALALPLSAAVYALDGILIGAGDARYLMWSMIVSGASSIALALAALELEWGIVGVWSALLLLNVVRLATLSARFARRRWLVTGWA
ncbi:MAG: MATE family efflux transporter [Actinomycetota bacterium]|nr:MATE family efflux transporter [Actinomycetota bacterium]